MSKPTSVMANRRWKYVCYSSLFLGIALCGGLFAALIRDYHLNEESRQICCRAHLSRIGGALQSYNDKYGTFPPAYLEDESGAPAHSWRVLILPFVGAEDLYRRYNFDEPWDGPNNRQLAILRPDVFACASRGDGSTRSATSFVAIASPEAAMHGTRTTAVPNMSDAAHTILVVEHPETQINWLEPRDLDLREFGVPAQGLTDSRAPATHPDGMWTLFADGGLYLLKYSTTDDDLRTLLSTSASPRSKREAMTRAIGPE